MVGSCRFKEGGGEYCPYASLPACWKGLSAARYTHEGRYAALVSLMFVVAHYFGVELRWTLEALIPHVVRYTYQVTLTVHLDL